VLSGVPIPGIYGQADEVRSGEKTAGDAVTDQPGRVVQGAAETGEVAVDAAESIIPDLSDIHPVVLVVLVFVGLWLARPALEAGANATE